MDEILLGLCGLKVVQDFHRQYVLGFTGGISGQRQHKGTGKGVSVSFGAWTLNPKTLNPILRFKAVRFEK